MGNKSSVALQKDVFKNELKMINSIINSLIDKDTTTFNNPSYKEVAVKDVCETYNIILESSLKKQLKIHLQALNDAIYIVPKNDIVTSRHTFAKKSDLCNMIANHYNRLLKLLVVIKQVYDVENNGDGSLAGITLKNIRINKNIFEIRYCDVPQKLVTLHDASDFIDFSALSGFRYFCEELLQNEVERNTFLKNMRDLLARKSLKSMSQHMLCGDALLSAQEYAIMLQSANVNTEKCDRKIFNEFKTYTTAKAETLHMFVAENNPLLHDSICRDKKQLIIDCSEKTKDIVRLLSMYTNMKASYTRNINQVLRLTHLIVQQEKDGTFILRDLTSKELDDIELQVKKLIVKFYFQSLINFYSLLDFAKTLQPTLSNWNDRL